MKKYFVENLLKWAHNNNREYFLKGDKNPYYIWLREIILQQTRLEQGMPYFRKFTERFPEISDLAAAGEDQVLKLWQGLGYYSRARNLHYTAKIIVEKHEGIFPSGYEELLNLKGVGEYTAAAISSFAFQKPYAVVDGNVTRVLCRFFGIKGNIAISKIKKEIRKLASELIDRKDPAAYNQAIMDFGATVCKPAKAECHHCILKSRCYAYRCGIVDQIPCNSKKNKRRKRYFNYLVFHQDESFFLEKRIAKDIWKGLYQFPLLESDRLVNEKVSIEQYAMKLEDINKEEILHIEPSKTYRQLLSHQEIHARYWKIRIQPGTSISKFKAVKKISLLSYAYPKIIDCYLKENILT